MAMGSLVLGVIGRNLLMERGGGDGDLGCGGVGDGKGGSMGK
jgi:hypothetical protein